MTARQLLLPGPPVRIQRRRAKGWRMPAETVYVGRGSRWGNPFRIGHYRGYSPAEAVADFRWWLDRDLRVRSFESLYGLPPSHDEIRQHLAGKNLACWCAPGAPCHADVLLEIANAPAGADDGGKHE